MMHAFWIFCRIVSGIWLLAVFQTYGWRAYYMAKTDPVATGLLAFLTTLVALGNVMDWRL